MIQYQTEQQKNKKNLEQACCFQVQAKLSDNTNLYTYIETGQVIKCSRTKYYFIIHHITFDTKVCRSLAILFFQ